MAQPKRTDLELKRVFLVAMSSPERTRLYSTMIETQISNATIFTSSDSKEALFKIENVPPHVLVIDSQLSKSGGFDFVQRVLSNPKLQHVSIVIISEVPEKDQYVDQVVTRQVQYYSDFGEDDKFNHCITRALNRISLNSNSSYHLKFMTPGELLFREGEIAESVFIVRKGQMHAIKNFEVKPTLLGVVFEGEFVGEMAHINNEPRSATVKAVLDCELIEIPNGTLDLVLFSKPVWAKALVATLSKRLRSSNNNMALKTA